MLQSGFEMLAALGMLTDTPAGKGVAFLYTLLGGVLVWAARRWVFSPLPHRQEICYSFISKDLVSPGFFDIPGLEIVVNGAKQVRVALVNLCIWNHGSKVIRNDDWAPKGPLTISIPKKCQILSLQITAASQVACNFQIFQESHEESELIRLTFDFCGQGDGAVLQIVHTGSPLDKSLLVSGTLIEGEKVRCLAATPLLFKSKLKRAPDTPIKRRITVYVAAFAMTTAAFFAIFFFLLSFSATAALFVSSTGSGLLTLSDVVRDAFQAWRLKGQPRLSPVLRDGLLGIKHAPSSNVSDDKTWTL